MIRKNYFVVGLILLFLASGLLCYAQSRTPPGKRLDPEIYTGRWLLEYTPLAKLPGKSGGVAAV